MSLRSIFKGVMLVTLSAALIAVITIAGNSGFCFLSLRRRPKLERLDYPCLRRPDL